MINAAVWWLVKVNTLSVFYFFSLFGGHHHADDVTLYQRVLMFYVLFVVLRIIFLALTDWKGLSE